MISWQDPVMSCCSVVFLLGAPGAAFRAKQSTRVGYSLAILTMMACKGSLGLWMAAGIDLVAASIWVAGSVKGFRKS